MNKAQIWISVIIYTLVAVLALVLILNAGLPLLNDMKDRAVFSKVKDAMLSLDSQVTQIASQGEGSQADVSFEVRDGKINFQNGQLIWELETKSKIMSPRTSTSLGNLLISSNANVAAYDAGNSFIMQTTVGDEPFIVNISKIGSPSEPIEYNTSGIINYIDYDGNKMAGTFNFTVNGEIDSFIGTGYTELVPSGNSTNLGRAKVIAHLDNDFAEYELEFILESYSDFLIVRLKNFNPK